MSFLAWAYPSLHRRGTLFSSSHVSFGGQGRTCFRIGERWSYIIFISLCWPRATWVWLTARRHVPGLEMRVTPIGLGHFLSGPRPSAGFRVDASSRRRMLGCEGFVFVTAV
jgi:hypothetical protein